MRFVLILPLCLLIILINLSRTTADKCRCECCGTNGCSPGFVGDHQLMAFYCSELVNCKQTDCSQSYVSQCPPTGAAGQTRAVCVSFSERLFPAVILIIGMNFLLQWIKT